MNPDYQKLLKRIESLEKWKEQRERQQISYPLDTQSQTILNKYFLTATGNVYDADITGAQYKRLLVTQNGVTNLLFAFTTLIQYSANASTDRLALGLDIINRRQGAIPDDTPVYLLSGDGTIQSTPTTNTAVPPAPLLVGPEYYVVSGTGGGTSIKLSATLGGAAINLTDAGTGQQFIYYFV